MYRHNHMNMSHLSLRVNLRETWFTTAVGFSIFTAGIVFLFWVECRAVETARLLEHALDAVIPLQMISVVQPENEGQLVHISGPLEVAEPLTEPEYGISVPAVKLKRRVQLYQWAEEEYIRKFGDRENSFSDTSYSYSTEWRDKIVDSSKFYIPGGHLNPKEFPLKSGVYFAETVTIGGFHLSNDLKEEFRDYVMVTSDERPERRDIKLHAGLYYHSLDVWNPEVGDTRVQFSYAGHSGDDVSVIARQVGSELHGDSGLLLLLPGRHSLDSMLAIQHSNNNWFTRAYRILGWFILYLGSTCCTPVIRILMCRYGLLYLILAQDGCLSTNVAVSLSVSLIVIAAAWLVFRPWLSLTLLSAAAVPFLYSALFSNRLNHAPQYFYSRLPSSPVGSRE